MTKHRMTPFFALTKTSNLKVGVSDDLQDHLIELMALEALSEAAGVQEGVKSTWATAISKQSSAGALSMAAFRGKVVPNHETGRPEPELTASRNLSMDEFRTLGLFDDLGRADTNWVGDDVALGINFSRLHRIARIIENRAPDFMRNMQARIQEDMRAADTYMDLDKAAERRLRQQEKARKRQHEEWLVQQEERERAAKEARAREHEKRMDQKRKYAAMFGKTFDDDFKLDNGVEIHMNTTTKGYENAFKTPMPEPWAKNGPFTWIRVHGVEGRFFFDAKGDRIPEPS